MSGPLVAEGGSLQALLQSFTMIIFSEIGDKTFLIAGILAMRHARLTVFLGAFGSLVVMSILSAALGHLLPTLIPRTYTQLLASLLFFVFGVKMLAEARAMEGGAAKIREEMREVEEEIEDDAAEAGIDTERSADEVERSLGSAGVPQHVASSKAIPLEEMEQGGRVTSSDDGVKRASPKSSFREGFRNFCSLLLGPVFVQAFILTFLGEWGDRSQIATIALGAAHNVYIVTVGTVVGHACCTALAVIGGRYVSTKISVKHVTFGGAILFILFGFIYLYEAYSMESDIDVSMSIPESHS